MLRARLARLLLTTLVLLAVLACLLSGLVPDAWQRASAALFPPAATTTATPTPTATPLIPTPVPVVGLLAPPPTDCPPSPPLDSISADLNGTNDPVTAKILYGRSPVWVLQDYELQGTVHVRTGMTPVPYPATLVDWEVGPNTYPTVTARATDLRTGELAWWSDGVGSGARPQTPVLSFVPRGTGAFRGIDSSLFFTHAGCYRLDVTWQGGEWSSIFAAGTG